MPFHAGLRESVDWFMADPARRTVNAKVDAVIDLVLERWKRGMDAALKE